LKKKESTLINKVKEKIDIKFIKFLFVGGLNTLFGYGIFALLIYLGLHYALAAGLGTVLGILFNFKTTGVLVFKNHDNRLIFKFFGVYGITYIVNVLALSVFNFFQISNYIAGAILILPMAVLSFILFKKYVFKEAGNEKAF
jgi:putative flippase GtrA